MNFLRRLFKVPAQVPTQVLAQVPAQVPAQVSAQVPIEDEIEYISGFYEDTNFLSRGLWFSWEMYQKCQKPPSSTIGGPYTIDDELFYRSFYRDFNLEDFCIFSPSGRYILYRLYNRSALNDLNVVTGRTVLLGIVDFSDRRLRLYANELVGSHRDARNKNQVLSFLNAYWISDLQIVSVYVKNFTEVVQTVCTINYETRTFKEEIYEYSGEMENQMPVNPFCRTPKNPLLIDNKAYFTVLLESILYLIPWIPLNKTTNTLYKIRLIRDDAIFQNGAYYLVAAQNLCHINYGNRVFFFMNAEYEPREEHDDVYVEVLSIEMACIDFSKHKNIDLSEGRQLPFELAEFTTIDWDRNWYYGLIVYVRHRSFSSHGRYVLFDSDDEEKYSHIFDMEDMTVGTIETDWIPGATVLSDKIIDFKFTDPVTREAKFRVAPIDPNNPPSLKSLADICREKLIFSNKSITVAPKLLNIIFPS